MKGSLVEVEWLDAVFYGQVEEVEEAEIKQGGSSLKSVGYVIKADRKTFLICAELDGHGRPHRDFTLIPRSLVRKIRVLRKDCVTI